MAKLYSNKGGLCPTCGELNYTSLQERQEGQTLMQCVECSDWSVRTLRGIQFPLQDPTDNTSMPGHRVEV